METAMWRNAMNYHKISMFGTMLCLLGLGFSDTAAGQTITTQPPISSGMSFQVQSGGAQAVQNLSINTSNGATTLVVTVPAGQTWLTVNGEPGGFMFFPNSPATLPVQVNTSGLSNGQTVTANITIAINNLPSTQVSFPVSMTVGTPSLLSANPGNLSFSAVTGSSFGTPTSIPITVTSNGSALTYNVSASTTTGGSWLLLSNTLGIPTNSGSPGFSVSVNASTLGVGTYAGLVTLQSTSTGDSTTIPVTLSVTAGALLNVTGTLNNFAFQAGSSTPSTQSQNLMISTSGGSLNYQVIATAVSGPSLTTNWLVVTPAGGQATPTPSPIALSLNYLGAASLPVGTYVINLAISPTASSGNTTNETVTLVVSNNPLLSVNNNQLTFTIPFGTTPQSQQVQLSSSNGASVPYTVLTNQSWLRTSVSNGTTAQNSVLTITADPTGLNVNPQPYTGTVTIFPANGDQYSLQVAVSLTVTSATTTLFAAPAALLYSYQTTQAPPNLQLVGLSSPTTTGFSVTTTNQSASNCPTSNWLVASANQFVTPATLSVSVLTTGMTAGFCSGTVIVTYNNGAQNTTVNIPVFVDIASTPLLTVTPDPGFGVVTASSGTNSVLQSRILLGSTDGSALGYSAFASTPGAPVPWLSLGNSQGNTQQYLQVFVLPSGLPVGVYTGSIMISANNSSTLPSGQLTIPVVLTVSANTTVAVSPTTLTFTQAQGAATAPAAQNINLTASGGNTAFTVSVAQVTGGSWLQVTPLSGTATGTITASVPVNTLSVGTYTANITVRFQNAATASVTIPVSLVITAPQPVVAASPSSLTFSYQLGGTAPASQQVNVTSSSGAVNVAVTATSSPAWFSVTPSSGTTGFGLTVSVNTAVLTNAQTLNGTITLTPTGQAPVTVPVTLTVTGTPAPQLVSISNSASGGFGFIAPGELITIKGINLGPSTAANFSVAPGGTVSNTLSNVQVLFDTIPGTPIYVSSSQINVIVPYDIAGRATTNVTVSFNNQASAGIPQNVANQAPGIFTDSSTGLGQASVVNQNGTLNGPAAGLVLSGQNVATTPAAAGSVISVFMTGGGQTSPLSTTGTVTPGGATLYKIPGTVTALIGGVNAPVQFAGAAPGEVTGVIQVNILVPAGVSGSALPLSITVNNSVSPSGTTVAVQ
jgi:uncharacterized protein (TIGR03437 family)